MSSSSHKNPLTQIDMNIIYLMLLGRIIMISEYHDMIINDYKITTKSYSCISLSITRFQYFEIFLNELLRSMNILESLIWYQRFSSRDESYISICLESLDATLFKSSKG